MSTGYEFNDFCIAFHELTLGKSETTVCVQYRSLIYTRYFTVAALAFTKDQTISLPSALPGQALLLEETLGP